jgi:LuxR family transcriptional regulator, maltose regulon positive regulatory protein
MRDEEVVSPQDRITDREREVLIIVAQGLSNKEIALLLNIRVKTVESHLHNIYRKFDVTNRVQALRAFEQYEALSVQA